MKQRISKKEMPAMAANLLTWPSGIAGFNEFGDIVLAIIRFLVNAFSFLHLPGIPA
ncbi:MAG: hypothetical protein HZB26_11605 [Candidatus Hydrogenedentes bacterium]|nr:hypothetical protein [Candidatus Hydrogenedentota bacterium]